MEKKKIERMDVGFYSEKTRKRETDGCRKRETQSLCNIVRMEIENALALHAHAVQGLVVLPSPSLPLTVPSGRARCWLALMSVVQSSPLGCFVSLQAP